jgi:hypothetical protein
VIAILFLFLAGLAALGFLFVVGRNRTMPPVLRIVLIIAAIAIFAYVAWFGFRLVGAALR